MSGPGVDDVILGGLKPITLPKKKPRRMESCATCYWSERLPNGSLECHGEQPTVNLIAEPHPLERGKQMLRPFAVWPPVGPDHFCRHWERMVEQQVMAEEPVPA